MDATKTKLMTKKNLKMMSQVLFSLLKHSKLPKSKTKIEVITGSEEELPQGFLGPDELEEFVANLFLPEASPIDLNLLHNNVGFYGMLGTLFDLKSFALVAFHTVLASNLSTSEAWKPNEITMTIEFNVVFHYIKCCSPLLTLF
ncbi:hypothetical protein CROQUDRAFT_130496 [Cronartium quercuum f. sp. fusiforme G11]|uniref:Uncharacterized protein n=1 Tax=Cronartium quercuum f. sp. fusiforme G11 TaxID=708437 RepID=A0A9P6TFV4_9BASI|nr:hypothetical protein CROQUDRAFT_130496 [Cronartium quercuum f. sp. fusiforme G11]